MIEAEWIYRLSGIDSSIHVSSTWTLKRGLVWAQPPDDASGIQLTLVERLIALLAAQNDLIDDFGHLKLDWRRLWKCEGRSLLSKVR